jgi:ATP-dependent protease ClpP protease subunit
LTREDLLHPDIRLLGNVDEAMLTSFLDQLRNATERPGHGRLIVEMTTAGGDADIGRRIGLEVELALAAGRDLVFVYSAGVTVMASFPQDRRFLTSDTMLLIHARQLETTLSLSGPVSASEGRVKALLAQLQASRRLEQQGFAKLAEGAALSAEEIVRKAQTNWYLTAAEASSAGLIAGVL